MDKRPATYFWNRGALGRLLICALACALADGLCLPAQPTAGGKDDPARDFDRCLTRMGEPRLADLAKDPEAEIYRLTILPTWGNPIVVRVERHNNKYSLSAHRFDGQAGYSIGKLVEQKDVWLSEHDSETLDQLISNLKLFDIPTDDGLPGIKKDGDDWIIEGVSGGKYHLVLRWCATKYGPKKRGLKAFVAFSRFLIDKSTLSERPKNKGYKLI